MKLLLFVILSFLLANCATKPPDVFVFKNLQQHLSNDPVTGHLILSPSPLCVQKINEAECGYGVSIMTGREIFVGEDPAHYFNKKPWSVVKQQSLYVPAIESYAPIATYMINTCAKNKCDPNVDKIKVKLDSLSGVSAVISSPLP